MLMSLGLFVFNISNLAYDELVRRTDWRFGDSARVGARNAKQFLGPGGDLIDLTGQLVPAISGDATSIDTLRAMGDTGEAYPLVDGIGRQLGVFHITSVEERQKHLFEDGVPRLTEFCVSLARIEDGDAPTSAVDIFAGVEST